MANITAEVRRLWYSSRYEFETATSGVTQPISAFITGEPGLVIGFKSGTSYRYLQAAEQAIATVQQQVTSSQGLTIGKVRSPYGEVMIPASQSGYGQTNENNLLSADYYIASGSGNLEYYGFAWIRICTQYANAGTDTPVTLWFRYEDGAGSTVDFGVYANQEDADNKTNRLAGTAGIPVGVPGVYSMADSSGNLVGWFYSQHGLINFGESYPLIINIVRKPGQFAIPATAVTAGLQVKVRFHANLRNGTDVEHVNFRLALHEGWTGEFPVFTLDYAPHGSSDGFVAGEFCMEILEKAGSTCRVRVSAQLAEEGANTVFTGGKIQVREATLGFSGSVEECFVMLMQEADDEGGDLLLFELYDADVHYVPGSSE